jgi:hypothetical protein
METGLNGVGYSVRVGEHVEAANGICHHVDNQELRRRFGMANHGRQHRRSLTVRMERSISADVAVGSDSINIDRVNVVADAFKLGVNVKVADAETTAGVEFDDCDDFFEDGGMFAVRHGLTVRNWMSREMVCRKMWPWTKKKSIQSVTLW